MRYRLPLILALLFGLCSLAAGQYRNASPAGDTGDYLRSGPGLRVEGFRGLLDPARMHMSHSVSMGYASVGGRGVSQGLYMNRIDYRISDPLSLTTQLGYRFQPSGPAEWNPANNGTDFVGGADLNWRPSRNSLFRFSVYRGLYPDPYYRDYGWGPYDYSYRPSLVRP